MMYSEFNAAVRAAANPDGEAENLVANHSNYVLDALIDLQTKCVCLQQNHTDYLCAASSFYHCGVSVFEVPRGFIRSLSTIVPGDRCCVEVPYTPVSKNDMDCMIANQASFSFCSPTELHPYDTYLQDGVYVPFPDPPLECFDYVGAGDTSLDKSSRAREGFFTIDRGQLWVNPRIQSDELIKLEWEGIKRSFAGTDILDDAIFNREVVEAAELYLRGKQAAIDECDYTRSLLFNNENMSRPGQYQVRRADLIYTCEKERRPPKRNYCYDTRCGNGVFLGASSSSSSSSSSGGGGSVMQVFFGVGDPNGVQTATRPAIFYTAAGALWYKTGDGTNNTGWELSIAGA